MLQEMADAQARSGEGVSSLHALVSPNQLKEYESKYLTGAWTTVSDVVKALSEAARALRDVAAHGQGEWSAVIPTKDARRLLVSAMRVPGRQKQLALHVDLRDTAHAEAALSLAAAKRATEIAVEAREHGMYIEELQERLKASPDPHLTQKVLRAIRPTAPQILVDGTSFPSINGAALPRTLPSSRVHKLLVGVAAVNDVDCVSHVSVQSVLHGDGTLRNVRELLVKCPDPTSRKHLVAAQFADEIITIHVGGEFPTMGGAGKYKLHLVELAAECSTAEMLEKAVNKIKRAEQLTLIAVGAG